MQRRQPREKTQFGPSMSWDEGLLDFVPCKVQPEISFSHFPWARSCTGADVALVLQFDRRCAPVRITWNCGSEPTNRRVVSGWQLGSIRRLARQSEGREGKGTDRSADQPATPGLAGRL